MAVKTFDPAKLQIIVAGIPIQGLAPDTFCSVERSNQSFNVSVGADGESARAKTNDKSGTVTITLIQSSASNDLLSALCVTDELSGDGVGPLLIKDLNGTTLIAAESCWIQKPASAEFGQEISTREWVIETGELNMFIGGSSTTE